MANYEFRIENLKTTKNLTDITSFKHILARNLNNSLLGLSVFNNSFKANLLEIKDYVSNVFLHARNSCELMLNTIDADIANCIAFES